MKKTDKPVRSENTCANCRYFMMYYIKHDQRFAPLHSGHCMNRDVNDRGRNKRYCGAVKRQSFNDACEFWETDELRKEERKSSLRKTLCRMAVNIEKMVEVLDDDMKTKI